MLTTFNLDVPVNGSSPVSLVTMHLTLANTSAPTLTITRPGGVSSHTFDPIRPSSPLPNFPFPAPAHTSRQYRAIITRTGGDIALDRQCTIDLVLASDFNPATCSNF